MARLYGRAPRGRRLKASAPFGHWMTTTFVGALRCDQITAPCVFDGPMNGPCFLAYVEQFLAPTLRKGDVVDNLPSHKVAGVREAIERAGATLHYLPPPLATPPSSAWRGPSPAPPCSPDFNPIEQAFAKLKAALRKAAARTFEALIKAIAQALAEFKPQECANYIANSGYPHAS